MLPSQSATIQQNGVTDHERQSVYHLTIVAEDTAACFVSVCVCLCMLEAWVMLTAVQSNET